MFLELILKGIEESYNHKYASQIPNSGAIVYTLASTKTGMLTYITLTFT